MQVITPQQGIFKVVFALLEQKTADRYCKIYIAGDILTYAVYFEKICIRWTDALKRAGLLTLKMLSVNGEIPYGGRSGQFLHNEAHAALIMEYEAVRYAKLGDMKTASRFKSGLMRALDVAG